MTIHDPRQARLARVYESYVLDRPLATLAVVILVVAFFAAFAPRMQLGASADSLMLEDDQDLDYNRTLRARYGSDDFLVVTYSPEAELFSQPVLEELGRLRDELRAVEGVSEVVSILDVPLLQSPPIDLDDLPDGVNTLEDLAVDRTAARTELLSSPLYRNLIVSPDGRTTAIRVDLREEDTYQVLFRARQVFVDKRREQGSLSAADQTEFERLDAAFEQNLARLREQQDYVIADVRDILDRYRDGAKVFLGGVPMIISDSLEFIRSDLAVFGTAVILFIILLLALAFRRPRWVVLSLGTCFAAGIAMVGFLGLVEWPVTIVSSNFMSLLLILTLSLTLHLIVRYRELHVEEPRADQRALVRMTLHSKAVPSLYTTLTTMVAFGSLLVSRIGPVTDFGWMMVMGLALAFLLSFTLFPAGLMLVKPLPIKSVYDPTVTVNSFFARLVARHGKAVLIVSVLLAVVSIAGTTRLTVENRFIDYFRKSTEIYKGMSLIDRELGGTTPLDVIVDAPLGAVVQEEIDPDDPFAEELAEMLAEESGIASSSYWFNNVGLEKIQRIHEGLEAFPETGKVASLATTAEIFGQLSPEILEDDFVLSVLYAKLPDQVRDTLIDPYFSEEHDEIRFQIRVFESDPTLRRGELLRSIRTFLIDDMGLPLDTVKLGGVLVLYHNVLQSLFRSQILTLGAVFLAIMVMFLILFRSFKIAVVAIIPNVLSAVTVLGLMGWLNIRLDLMTITIAAITIGIAVDDTLHYIHRFRWELARDQNYWAAVMRSHRTVGRAMVYTSVTITLGFSILALSKFVPTVYFGLLTGFAMMIALLLNLTLLPQLLVMAKVGATPRVVGHEIIEVLAEGDAVAARAD
jgi:predicted RND superfamily exporter protein